MDRSTAIDKARCGTLEDGMRLAITLVSFSYCLPLT